MAVRVRFPIFAGACKVITFLLRIFRKLVLSNVMECVIPGTEDVNRQRYQIPSLHLLGTDVLYKIALLHAMERCTSHLKNIYRQRLHAPTLPLPCGNV